MYPFGEQAYPRNRWYIAAYSHEIGDQPFERTLLDTPVALYRTSEGKAVAMYGLCPHRYFPLARGKVEGDALVCGYHGFTFAASGKCTRIPSQETGANYTQPTYQLEERGFLTWIWMGDPARADTALIPPYEVFGLDQPGWRVSGGDRIQLNARMSLLTDNLMDLTHLPYVHNQISGGDIMLKGRLRHEERAGFYRLTQEMPGPWTPWHSALWGEGVRRDGDVMTHMITDFYGPELIRTSGPQVVVGEADGAPLYLAELNFMHGATPETANTTHLWAFQTRNTRLDEPEFEASLVHVDLAVRAQDLETMELVEKTVDRASMGHKELMARADKPAVLVRDKVRKMIEAESPARVR